MKGRGAVKCPRAFVGTPNQTIWINRGGTGRMSGSGPTGRKTRPAAMLARSLAERAGVAAATKARQLAVRRERRVIYGKAA